MHHLFNSEIIVWHTATATTPHPNVTSEAAADLLYTSRAEDHTQIGPSSAHVRTPAACYRPRGLSPELATGTGARHASSYAAARAAGSGAGGIWPGMPLPSASGLSEARKRETVPGGRQWENLSSFAS